MDYDAPFMPFSNGSQAHDWNAANCERCRHEMDCPHNEAIGLGWIIGSISMADAIAIGAVMAGPLSYNWPCPAYRNPDTGKAWDIDGWIERDYPAHGPGEG